MRDNNGKFAKGNSGRPKGSKNKDISVFKKALLIQRICQRKTELMPT